MKRFAMSYVSDIMSEYSAFLELTVIDCYKTGEATMTIIVITN